MPEDAWSLKAVIKTSRGTHWMSFDRWGDSTHKMSTYNNRKHPSHKDQMYIDQMEAENRVMFPYQEPYAVTRSYPVGDTEQPNRINQRAENLKIGFTALQKTHSTGKQENGDHSGSPYRRPKLTGPQGRYRKRKNQNTPAWKSQGIAHKGLPPPPTRQDLLEEDELPDDTAFLDKTNDETDYETPPEGPQDKDDLDKNDLDENDMDKNCQTKSLMDLDLDLVNYFEENKQGEGKGDLEPISPPAKATSPKAESNILTETWYLEPNKVRFMDDIDTHRANVGRHIPKQGKLVRAKIVPHLVFVNPPASPDGEQPPMDTTKGEASPQPTVEKEAATPELVGHSEDQSPKERPNSLPIPLEPLVMDLSKPKKDLDPDCLMVEDTSDPLVPYKPKRNWAKRKIEQTKKTLVLYLPRCDAPKKREMEEAKQEDMISSKADEKAPGAIPPPTPESENNPLEELD